MLLRTIEDGKRVLVVFELVGDLMTFLSLNLGSFLFELPGF
jgi:hypothetical protein